MLDIYEGGTYFYQTYEQTLHVCLEGGTTKRMKIFFYSMPTSANLGLPSMRFLLVCLAGYSDFGFDSAFLEEALLA